MYGQWRSGSGRCQRLTHVCIVCMAWEAPGQGEGTEEALGELVDKKPERSEQRGP